VWTAVAIYALAFIAYAIDLGRRSDIAIQQKDAAKQRELVGAGGHLGIRVDRSRRVSR
jgi:hypothetical protein